MLLARLTEPRRLHLGHSVHLCIHPIPSLLWSKGLGLAAQRLEYSVSGVSPMSDTALFIVVNVISSNGCTPQLTSSPSPQRPCSQYASPGPHEVCHLIYLTLSCKFQVSIRIRRDIPWSLHMYCPQFALDSGVSFKALAQAWVRCQWPDFACASIGSICGLNLLVGIINAIESTSK